MTHNITIASYGSWDSPITEEIVVKGSLRLSDLSVQNGKLFWVEGRPEEKGRFTVVSYDKGKKEDYSLPAYNIRSRVHEYGGLSYLVHGQNLYFVNFADQHLYKMDQHGTVTPIIEEKNKRFAHFVASPDGNYLYGVMEDHENLHDVTNSLVQIDIAQKKISIIASGYDFYGEVALSPSGKKLAWIAWNHPNMPWDGTDLFLADLGAKGLPENEKKIAGGEDISILGPLFSPTDVLYYASDESGFWNFYTLDRTDSLCPMQADVAEPLWVLGVKRSDFVFYKGKFCLACIYTEKAIDRIGIIDLEKGSLETIDTEFTALQSLRSYLDGIVCIAASPTILPSVVYFDLSSGNITTLFASSKLPIDQKFISSPLPIDYKTSHDQTAYAIYYPPCNPYFQSHASNGAPPLIVRCHGGPTAHKKAVLDLTHQYWTSRGFAVVEVNYRGSSGYGRDYRRLLFDNWGTSCVDDAIAAASHLIAEGLASSCHIAIVGGSAGGYTVLAALAFRNFFHAGVSYYGVSDLEALAKETHKFEAHYLDKLVSSEDWHDLSPLCHADKITVPLLLLQGGEDRIVPPVQSEAIHLALKANGVPSTYILFPNEQHGFRSKDTLIRSLQAEYAFYKEVFEIKE